MGVLGSICSLYVRGEDSPTKWSLPELWEDFLEEAVPGKDFDSGQGLQEGLFCGRHNGLDPDADGHMPLILSLPI